MDCDAQDSAQKQPLSFDRLLEWDRGHLWDYICATYGLSNLDICNSQYLTQRSPFRCSWDSRYLFHNCTIHRALANLANSGTNFLQEAKQILSALGIRSDTRILAPSFLTYYGQLIDFAWRSSASPGGTGFMPIYALIERLQKKYPNDVTRLHTVQRRLAYLESLRREVEGIADLYDFSTIPTLSDWMSNKVETFATLSGEVALITVEYHLDKAGKKPRRLRFEELADYLPDIDSIFVSLNASIDGFLVTSLRNEMVHSTGFRLEILNGQPRVRVSFSEGLLKFGCTRQYLQSDILSEKLGSKIETVWRDGIIYFIYEDARFPYVTYAFPCKKKGVASLEDAIASYDLSMKEFTRIEANFLFLLSRKAFEKWL